MKNLMKKIFAPLAVFALAIGVSISVNNQSDIVETKAESFTDAIQIKGWGGYTDNSFSAVGVDRTGTAPTSGATIAMQIFNGSTGALRGNQSSMSGNFNVRNTTEYPGYIRKITLSATSTGTNYFVTESARSILSLGATPFDIAAFPTNGAITADVISSTLYTVTWTVPTGTNFKYFKLHSLKTAGTVLAGGAEALSIEYETVTQSFGTLDHIEVSGGITSYLVGEEFTNAGLIVTAFDTTNFSKTVTSYTTNKDGYTFLNTDIGNVTITVSYTEGTTVTSTYDVSVSELIEFSKITSASNLYFGAEYVIVAEGATVPKIMTTNYTTFFGEEDVSITSDKVILRETHQIIKLVISPTTNSYGFQLVNGPQAGKYLSLDSNNNVLNSSSTLSSDSSWLVSFDYSGNVNVNSVSYQSRYIRYNNSSPRFATYTTSQTSIQLYLNIDSINHSTSAIMFSTEVNEGKGYLAHGTCQSSYEFLDSVYDRLSVDAKTIFDTSSDSAFVSARERLSYLESWVAQNPSANPTREAVNNSSNNNLVAVVSIGFIGLTSILGYYFINKKKSLG